MTASNTTRCFCQSFEFGEFDGGNEDAVSYDTNCSQTTTRIFAQGHDAKLAGYLVRAEMAGEEISLTEGGLRISFMGATDAAMKVSEAFAAKVQAMLDAARARVAKKASKAATRTARQSAKKAEAIVEPTTRDAKIKVGRWTYDATIELATGEAHYFSKLGNAKTAEQGTYSEV